VAESEGNVNRILRYTSLTVFTVLSLPVFVGAEVSRLEVVSRRDVAAGRSFGSTGPYEQIAGRLHFLIDPSNKRNQVITDLDKATRNATGKIEMSTDLVILRPRDASRGNGIALFDIVNRGRGVAFAKFDAPTSTGGAPQDEFGDGFLLNRGYTIIQVGWEFDARREGAIRFDPPRANGVIGFARATFIPTSKGADATVGDLAGYLPSNPAAAENTLTVRDAPQAPATTIPRAKWRLSGNVVTLEGGFEPGRIYELAYTAEAPPIAALGFAVVRDAASWVKYAPDAIVSAKYTLAFGSSQTGRYLREFLYDGFSTDERNRLAFDAVWPHLTGASGVNLNRRWSTPTSLSSDVATFFPFSDMKQRDPVTGVEEGLLENARAGEHQPKVFWTNTPTEYWEKASALLTTTPDGSKDLSLPPNVRAYSLAGTQHDPARFPPAASNGQLVDNPTDYMWAMRALLVGMERWLRDGVAPPASRYPRRQDGTLVPVANVAFPNLPDVTSPLRVLPGARGVNSLVSRNGGAGTPLPLLVSQVDKDGNELGGLRLPEVVVPLATTAGWNFRKAEIGGTHLLFPLLGSYIPFASTRSERERTHDPRPSIEERYTSREAFLKRIQDAAAPLVKDGYLLADDVPALVKRAGDHWDWLAKRPSHTTSLADR
jgi:alpha/beta hydrolase family protein